MDLRNLRTFLYVSEQCSFTKAAARLGYSQSTVSFQIKQLEEELDVRLFERIHHTVKLTDQGREVLRYARRMDKLRAELERELREEKEVTGHVRLAMADSLCTQFGRTFQDFWLRYPGISLKIIAAGTEEMFRLLNHNEVDLVFTLDNHIYNTEYQLIREEKIETHFVAAPNCPLAGREHVSVREVLDYPFLLTEKGMSYRRLVDEQLASRSLEVSPVLEMGNTEIICQLASRGAGCAFLPDYATDEDVKAGRLVRLKVDDFTVEVWKQLFCHRDKWVSPHLQSVMAYCAGI
ncbi:LysR family transcriptional regulator [Oscillibacter hominis]|uniref:LysR family transcriptional regulator n=1 Tax=Oscillibacter hominis TaxID=2763056 RepID=A0A7G9B600_9FIRM|nr:LysR family transcriptional regulator [Oscillibacter hominis]QNL44981.1 LysR family transcriptional regulator [Oscillibacter hominis]